GGRRLRHAHPAGAALERRPACLARRPLCDPRPARGEGPPARPGRRAEPGAGRPAAALREGECSGPPGAAGLVGHAAAPLGRHGSGAGGGRVTSQRRRPPVAARLLTALYPPEGAAAEAAIGDLEEEYALRADRGTLRAAAWYWAEAASLARGLAAERVRGWRPGRAPAGPRRPPGEST